jgi:mannose/cellobiose epimerase-like protein (N-acyl-D-glucosamine 2-epimerase family)
LRAYGMSFVVQACARAAMAGIPAALGAMHCAYSELERVFWEAEHQLYADELLADGTLSDYRGQNTNMHAVEANLAAYEATGKAAYLARAEAVARSVALGLSALCDGTIWEHYRADWSIDWDYNRPQGGAHEGVGGEPDDNAADKYRAWGFQPGHFAEWAKLLLLLDRHLPAAWHVPCAARLFRQAAEAWDAQHGGIPYAISPDGSICNSDKYYWVQTEALAAAALLARATGDCDYVTWYQRLWAYCWQALRDHAHGSWRCVAPQAATRTEKQDERAVATGYHIVVCCDDTLRALATPPSWGLPAAGIDDRNRP